MSDPIRSARLIFRVAGIYGLVALLPMFFAEPLFARYAPPALTHPEYFYGFLCAAGVWQLLYLAISGDPIRFRPLMPIAVLAKLNFVAAVAILFALGRLEPVALGLPVVDLVIGIAFAAVWLQMRREPSMPAEKG